MESHHLVPRHTLNAPFTTNHGSFMGENRNQKKEEHSVMLVMDSMEE